MAEIQPIATPRLIGSLSVLLERLALCNDRRRELSVPVPNSTAFHGVSSPAISIKSYLERIFRYANCSESCFLVAYVYLDRLARLQPTIGAVDSYNVHRLLITSVLVAAKFVDDSYYNNAYYAKIGGISTKEMNFLEVEFLFGLGFRLNVTPTTFHSYNCYIHRQRLLIQPTSIISSSPNIIVPNANAPSMRLVHHPQSCFSASNSVVDLQDEASSSSSHQHQHQHQLQHQQLAV